MIKIDNTSVMNFENAIRGARNPMNSWGRMDSKTVSGQFIMGENDLNLARRLAKAGSDHRKFVRQIFISVDITAPLYWWKEFDTYKVATVANSTSTMHKIHSKEFSLDDFSHDHLNEKGLKIFENLVKEIEEIRKEYVETKEKDTWYTLIQLLPSSYNQLRTVTLNYENVFSMYNSRKHHKLEEWHIFCDWILTLPYFKEIFMSEE